MAIIQNRLLELLQDDLSNQIKGALINVDGTLRSYPIYKTIKNGFKVTKYIYLDDVQAQGRIQSAVLVDSDGNALAIKNMQVVKGDSGLLVAFEFSLEVRGV
ncbi:hypothetical protein QIH01_28630 [Brevibacillus brevis]|uniref:hypothetical protein n=1 Tax=Brevibacillus brevis TaxID=1393 RepID=UPI0007D89E06|nr:hypothetical protein [Brevibacillus brevis]WGV59391.1 hypothetical protein QIH01_28630 [Brevibacillus brevis]